MLRGLGAVNGGRRPSVPHETCRETLRHALEPDAFGLLDEFAIAVVGRLVTRNETFNEEADLLGSFATTFHLLFGQVSTDLCL